MANSYLAFPACFPSISSILYPHLIIPPSKFPFVLLLASLHIPLSPRYSAPFPSFSILLLPENLLHDIRRSRSRWANKRDEKLNSRQTRQKMPISPGGCPWLWWCPPRSWPRNESERWRSAGTRYWSRCTHLGSCKRNRSGGGGITTGREHWREGMKKDKQRFGAPPRVSHLIDSIMLSMAWQLYRTLRRIINSIA